ncbi:MAG: hypothetical protein RIS90_1859 [Pseudomonadota bacterium]
MLKTSLPLLALSAVLSWGAVTPAMASKKARPAASAPAAPRLPEAGQAEARLIEIYRLLANAQSRQALDKARGLVEDYPDFHLAQLVYGDILASRKRPVRVFGDVPSPLNADGAAGLDELRAESRARLKALTERPPSAAVPAEFVNLSPRNRHAIAVDTSRSRLYLFENRPDGLKLLADYYISVGRSGVEKVVEGDLRTPLGVYFITSNLDPKSLSDFYGAGALPINYPNVLDSKRGKTGKGIWLHGTPPGQFSRPPLATDGCVVLTNPDLARIIRTVEIGTTPVVISKQLRWVTPALALADAQPFQAALTAWKQAKASGDIDALLQHYSADFNSYGKTLADWTPVLRTEQRKVKGNAIELKDLSMLRWTDAADTMVVTFGEVAGGKRTGPIKRQYWVRQGNLWKIFFESNIA